MIAILRRPARCVHQRELCLERSQVRPWTCGRPPPAALLKAFPGLGIAVLVPALLVLALLRPIGLIVRNERAPALGGLHMLGSTQRSIVSYPRAAVRPVQHRSRDLDAREGQTKRS